MEREEVLELLGLASRGLLPLWAPKPGGGQGNGGGGGKPKEGDDNDKSGPPPYPNPGDDLDKAKKELEKLKKKTYEIKLVTKSQIEMAIEAWGTNYAVGKATIKDLVDLYERLVNINEKIMAELKERIDELEDGKKGKKEDSEKKKPG